MSSYTAFEGTKILTVNWSVQNVAKSNLSALTNPTIQSAAAASAFKTALIAAIKTQSGFTTLDGTKLEIKKDNSGSAGAILTDTTDDNYITGRTIKVHLSLVSGYTAFEGTKILEVTWSLINLDTLPNEVYVSTALNTVENFKDELIDVLNYGEFENLDINKIKIEKCNGDSADSSLKPSDISTAGQLTVKLSVEDPGVAEFEGTKVITVNLRQKGAEIDLDTLSDTLINVIATARNLIEFKTNVVEALKSANSSFTNLTSNKIKIEKYRSIVGFSRSPVSLEEIDIVNGQIKLKLSVSATGATEFKGSKVITVNLTTT